MSFPTTQFLPLEQFSMVAAVSWLAPSECGFINLFPNPSLSGLDFRCAVSACVGATGDHFSPPARQCDATRSSFVLRTKSVRCVLDLPLPDRRFFRSNTADQRRCDPFG